MSPSLDSATEGGPASLPGELGVKLKEWTGIHWIVSLSREEGSATLVEIDNTARETRLVDARTDPDIMAILGQFPGAKVIDVRIRVDDTSDDDETAAPPAVIETAEGDILPGDDIDTDQ